MMTAAVCFTCTRDAATARVAIEALRRLLPEVPVYLSVEAADTRFPRGEFEDCRIVTAEGRRGNLNGLRHLIQAFDLYETIVKETGAGIVVKMDSDIVIHDWPFMTDMGSNSIVGVESATRDISGLFGALYCMTEDFVRAAHLFLQNPENHTALRHAMHMRPEFPEDISVWALAQLLGHSGMRLPLSRMRWIVPGMPIGTSDAHYSVLSSYRQWQTEVGEGLGRPPSMLELDDLRAKALRLCLQKNP